MKKFMTHIIVALSLATMMVSCDEDNHADATMTYYGKCERLTFHTPFSNHADSVVFDSLVRVALDELGYCGDKSLFQESAEVDVSAPVYAVAKCNEQAVKTYENKIKSISLSQVKSCVFSLDSEIIDGRFESPDDLPLGRFCLTLELINYSQGPLKKFDVAVN